jgi:hypothetical protein
MKRYCLPLSIGLAVLLANCGGSTSTALSGSVVDGKIQGAVVCLDVNSNALCDVGEPSAITDANGAYSFTYSGGSIAGMHVLAIVGTDAIDSDNGPVTTAYNMLAPATAPSYVTPLTTLVSTEMLISKGTADDAEKSVKASLGLEVGSTLLGKNVMDDPTLHAISQITAVAMGSAKEAVAGDNAAKDTSPADVMKQSINLVRNQVLTQVVGAGGKLNFEFDPKGSSKDMLAKMEAMLPNPIAKTVSGSIDNIVSASKAGDGTVLNIAAAFKTGLIIANEGTGDYIDANGERQSNYVKALLAEFLQFDVATTEALPYKNQALVLVNNKWFKGFQYSSEDYVFDGSNWVRSGNEFQGKPTASGNCVTAPFAKTGTASQNFCGVAKDLSGKPITDFIKDLCDPNKKDKSATCDAKALFPTGSIAYDFTASVNFDTYQLWGSTEWGGYTNGTTPITKITGDGSLLDYLKTNNIHRGPTCVTLKTGDKNSKSGTMQWAEAVNGCNNGERKYTEVTNFTVVTVGDREILKVELPNMYRKLRPGNQSAYTIFGYVNGTKKSGMYDGDFSPANFKQSIIFTGNPANGTQIVSPTLFDAVIAQTGAPKYPYVFN